MAMLWRKMVRARGALHLSFLSSGIGGVIGVLLLIFLTPVLAQWALAFSYSHLFWMAILGGDGDWLAGF